MFRIENDKNTWMVSNDKEVIFKISHGSEIRAYWENGGRYVIMVSGVHKNGLVLFEYENEDFKVSDQVIELSDGFYKVERSWRNKSCNVINFIPMFEGFTTFKPSFFLIPCVNYNGNTWGDGHEPKGLTYQGQPWIFSYDRTGLPSATFSEDTRYSVGLFVSDEDCASLKSACSLEASAEGMAHRLFWPEQESPVTYITKTSYGEKVIRKVRLKPDQCFSARFYICISLVNAPNAGWTKAYDLAWGVFARDVKLTMKSSEVWMYGIKFAKQLYVDLGTKGLFEYGFLPGGEHIKGRSGLSWEYRRKIRYEIGWCGQNGTLANALIYDYVLYRNEDSLAKGVKVLDTWCKKARMRNGLFYTLLDDMFAGLEDVRLDTCNLGWGAWMMMEGYELAKQIGIHKDNWLDMGLGLCDFFKDNFNPEFMFGNKWSIDGRCLDKEGTIGSFILIAMLKAYKITGMNCYLECASQAFRRYIERDLDNMVCTAGALDTSCVDKETCWPLLKSALDLYEITGNNYYLEKAVLAGYYITSWMFHYEVLFESDCDINWYGYRTYGATSVSVQHHHLDFMACLMCRDFIRLYKLTGNKIWLKRALAQWHNSLQCISDGKMEVHGMVRPEGSQNEAYFNCNWSWDGNNKKGDFNDWLVAWPTAFRLLTLMREKDWNLLDTGG